MPLITPEDIGTTPRSCLSPRRRLQAWERTNGKCVVCGERIDGARERWIIEHIRALELGGADELDNMGPAHEACGREKTRDDHARTAQAKRQKLRHIGAAVSAQPLPGSRATPLKRKVNGTVVPRADGPRRQFEGLPQRGLTSDPDPAAAPCLAPAVKARAVYPFATVELVTGLGEPRTAAPMNQRTRDLSSSQQPATNGNVSDAGAGEILPPVPAHLAFLFDERPLLVGESAEQYDALMRSVLHEVKPREPIEAIWTKDIIDLTWETLRYRGYKQRILDQARLQTVEELIAPMIREEEQVDPDPDHPLSPRKMATGWMRGSEHERTWVDQQLRERGIMPENVAAQAFANTLSVIERIERQITSASARRDTALREIERRRSAFGRQLRSSTDILDVDPNGSAASAIPVSRS
ncbi:HNH endonuclease [Methylobacterium durans]|uniref:HNH nuclease domain-containing protein n=1 Tax=Methylobacterium durans TaxID=2202825 RepID=A0A2U8W8B4_9HYPH|nr:HNH endonuclease signature motif containing protein [Methylobacterium durans]AWN41750.1 hypothetical protein DK389_16090 [Methylobacterium durans]